MEYMTQVMFSEDLPISSAEGMTQVQALWIEDRALNE